MQARAIAALVALTAVAAALASTGAAAVQLLLVSDLHLDPFYGKPGATRPECAVAPGAANVLGAYGCDAPLELVASAIRRAGAENPDVVLAAGDWLRHRARLVSPEATRGAIDNITALLSESFVRGQTVAATRPSALDALGNNDVVPDYAFNVSATYRLALSDIAASLRARALLTDTEAATFARCGFFRREITGLGPRNRSLDVIVINSLVWDVELSPPLSPAERDGGDPCGQFAFLENALGGSTNPAILVAHVPPTIDLHFAVEVVDGGAPVDTVPHFWFASFEARFRAVVAAHRDRIRMLVFGHTHHVAMITDADLGVPTLIVGSVSPIYDNLPSVLSLSLDDDTLRPQWATLRQIALPDLTAAAAWRDTSPAFAQVMGLPEGAADAAASFARMAQANARVCGNSSAAMAFYRYSAAYGRPISTCSAKCQLLTSCFLTNLGRNRTIACYERGCNATAAAATGSAEADSLTAGQRAAIAVVVSIVLVGVAAVVVRARHNRRAATDSMALSELQARPEAS
jgi:hypothetical protein